MEGRKIYVKHPSYNNVFVDRSISIKHTGKSILNGAPGPGSGRYPLGSGKNPYQDYKDRFGRFLDRASRSEDGTLTAIGKLRYRTTDKYKYVSDEDLQKLTNRRKKEKEYEDIHRQVSPGFRFQEKVGKSVEDAVSKAVGEAVKNLTSKELGNLVQKITTSKPEVRKETVKKVENVIKNLSSATKNFRKSFTVSKDEPEPSKSQEEVKKETVVADATESKPAENGKEKEKPVENKPNKQNQQKETKKEEPKQQAVKVDATKEKPKEQKQDRKITINKNQEPQKLDSGEISKIKSLRSKGHTIEEIAKSTGHSKDTVEKYILDMQKESPIYKIYRQGKG